MKTEIDPEVLRAVAEGNKSAQRLFAEALFAEVRSTFENMFLPFKGIKAETKPKYSRLAGKIDLLIDPAVQFSVVEDLPSQVEALFNELLGSVLLPFEEAIKGLLKIWKIPKNLTLTPEIVKTSLNSYKHPLPTHLWCGSVFVNELTSNEIWFPYYEPNTIYGLAFEGQLGKLKGLSKQSILLLTDLFRYDTLRFLEEDDLIIVSENQSQKVWIEWGAIKTQEDGSFMITATQYVGEM